MPNLSSSINIKDHGAVGNYQSDDTCAIQDSIDYCSQQGGGTVYVPPGRYLTGTIRFKKNITLYLENGASLCAAHNPAIFTNGGNLRKSRMLIADEVENIAICGQGEIVGTGQEDLQRRAGTIYDMKNRPPFRTGGVHFHKCKNVLIRDVRFCDSDNWTLCLDKCENVLIDGVHIRNNYFRTNSDGIDIVSCKDVRIANCNILTGDDGIVLKSFDKTSCQRVVVTGCIVESCATGLKIGTESYGDFHDILFSNCIVKNSYGGAGIFIKDGGTAERVKFSDCIFNTYDDPYSINLAESVYPIFLDIEKRKPDSSLGKIRNISFRNIDVYSENSILIQGSKASPIEDLMIQGLFIRVEKDFDFSNRCKPAGTTHVYAAEAATDYARQEAYVVLANVSGLFVDELHVKIRKEVFEKRPRYALWGHRLENGMLQAIRRNPSSTQIPIVCLKECRQIES